MILDKTWKFIWRDDSIWSWLISIVLAFIIVKYLIYPLLGLILGTSFPIVAVVSESMEHVASPICLESRGDKCLNYSETQFVMCGKTLDKKGRYSINQYWESCGDWYEDNGITFMDFNQFPQKDGFNKGDVMILVGKKAKDIKVGDIVVFDGNINFPIIHRVVEVTNESGEYLITTKGDNNPEVHANEEKISGVRLIGKAVLRLPLLGWVKIKFTELINIILGR